MDLHRLLLLILLLLLPVLSMINWERRTSMGSIFILSPLFKETRTVVHKVRPGHLCTQLPDERGA